MQHIIICTGVDIRQLISQYFSTVAQRRLGDRTFTHGMWAPMPGRTEVWPAREAPCGQQAEVNSKILVLEISKFDQVEKYFGTRQAKN